MCLTNPKKYKKQFNENCWCELKDGVTGQTATTHNSKQRALSIHISTQKINRKLNNTIKSPQTCIHNLKVEKQKIRMI